MKAERASGRAGETALLSSRSLAPSLPRQVVLGVDPGLATTGWGVVEKASAGPTLVAFGAILTSATLPLTDRLRQIHQALAEILETHAPSVLAIEELFFAKFAVSIAATAQARGVILLCAAERNVPVVEYNPRAVKMAVTGFGSASKFQIQSMIQRHFALKALPRPDDAADALAIALCHLQTNPMLVGASSKQRAASREDPLGSTPLAARRSPLAQV